MFELQPQGINAIIRAQARRAESDARIAEDEADQKTAYLGQAVQNARRVNLNLEQRAADLERKLNIEMAHTAGLEAQLAAYRNQYPDSTLRADSGQRYGDGDVKRRIRLIYEAAFDAKLGELMPRVDPATCRAD